MLAGHQNDPGLSKYANFIQIRTQASFSKNSSRKLRINGTLSHRIPNRRMGRFSPNPNKWVKTWALIPHDFFVEKIIKLANKKGPVKMDLKWDTGVGANDSRERNGMMTGSIIPSSSKMGPNFALFCLKNIPNKLASTKA